jgi:hypothetical protein
MDKDIMMEIREDKNMIYGNVDGKQICHIEYRTIGYKIKNIYLCSIYTMDMERERGYASQLLEYLIKKYGVDMDIVLSCHPYGLHFSSVDEFKKLQERTAKWYEGFGFVTTYKKEDDSLYEWKMIRKKNNIITQKK